MIARRTFTMILAASLGLNVGLAGVLAYRSINENSFRRQAREEMVQRRTQWSNRERTRADSLRGFPRLEREQINALGEMRRTAEEDIQPMRRQVQALHDAIQQELLRASPGEARLDSLAETTARLQKQIQVRLIRLMVEERAILSEDQYQWIVGRMVPGSEVGRTDRSRGGRDDRGRGDSRGARGQGSDARGRGGSTGPPPPVPPL